MNYICYTCLVLSYEHFLAACLVILYQYFHCYPRVAPQPQVSEYCPGHPEQSLMWLLEFAVLFVFSFAFGADFQLEEQLPQSSKVPSHVPRSQSLLKVVERVYHLMKLMISFVCDSLSILAGLAS
jgi:hypothetical protein